MGRTLGKSSHGKIEWQALGNRAIGGEGDDENIGFSRRECDSFSMLISIPIFLSITERHSSSIIRKCRERRHK
jgi:hypothetical protein